MWPADQMFDLVADVARYEDFLPWVVGVRVRSESETQMVADLIVGFSSLRETFTSQVNKIRPTEITVDYLDGPLKYLKNEWVFRDAPGGGCEVDFAVDFAFKSRIFEAVAGQMFDRALKKMIDAFIGRAQDLYGEGSSNSSATSAA